MLLKLAEQGDVNAQFILGFMYDEGEGGPKDAAKAVEWYTKAAEQGYAKAQYNLGNAHANGEGVPKDPAKAAHRWVTAVNQDGNWGLWAYEMVRGPTELPLVIDKYSVAKWDANDTIGMNSQ